MLTLWKNFWIWICPQRLIVKRSNIWIYIYFLKFQKVCPQMHLTSSESQEMIPHYLRKHLHWVRLLLGHNFLLLVWRNGIGQGNFPRFARTSFTCMCLWPQSIKIRADLAFVISHRQTYKSGRIFLLMVLASHRFSSQNGFEASRWNKWSNHIKEIENNSRTVSLGIIWAFHRQNISYPECQGSKDWWRHVCLLIPPNDYYPHLSFS